MKMVMKETFIDEMKWNGWNGVEWKENEMEWNENEVKWNKNGKEREILGDFSPSTPQIIQIFLHNISSSRSY